MTMIDEAEPLIQKFDTLVQSHTFREEPNLADTVTAILKVDSMPLESFGCAEESQREKAKQNIHRKIIESYYIRRLSQVFPLIDDSLFSRSRWVGVRFDSDEAVPFASTLIEPEKLSKNGALPERWIRIPLLVRKATQDSRYGRNRNGIGSVSWPGQRNVNAILSSEFPGSIGPKQLAFGDKALAAFYRIRADLLEHSRLASFARWNIEEPEIAAYWIPGLASIYVEKVAAPDRRDPALVLEAVGRKFLCCLWDASGEEPVEALLREFTVGGTVNKVS